MHGKHSSIADLIALKGKLVLTFQHEISSFPGSPDYHRIEVENVTSWTRKMICLLLHFASRLEGVVGITREAEDFNVTPFSQLARL